MRFCIIFNRGHRYLTFWFVFYIYFFSESCSLSTTTNLVNTQKCSVYVTCGKKNSQAPMSYICHVLPSQHAEPTKFIIRPLRIILFCIEYMYYSSHMCRSYELWQCEIYIIWDEDIYMREIFSWQVMNTKRERGVKEKSFVKHKLSNNLVKISHARDLLKPNNKMSKIDDM